MARAQSQPTQELTFRGAQSGFESSDFNLDDDCQIVDEDEIACDPLHARPGDQYFVSADLG